jgi:hypothetical protein
VTAEIADFLILEQNSNAVNCFADADRLAVGNDNCHPARVMICTGRCATARR